MAFQKSFLIVAIAVLAKVDLAFTFTPKCHPAVKLAPSQSSFLGAVRLKDPPLQSETASFDPLGLASTSNSVTVKTRELKNPEINAASILGATGFMSALTVLPEKASAIQMPDKLIMSSGNFDPSSFNPVCGTSDAFYRFLQGSAQAVVGPENFQEYGPLIASGLLRIRLELCVVESFFNEAVGPFIQQNGLSWVLPLHETVETFLAGTVFSLATTFILVGSTKLLTVIFTYTDFLIGAPMRLFGGFFFDRARGKPVTLDIGLGPFKTRVIGPKDLEVDEDKNDWSVDLANTGPGEIAVIILSGGVKAGGQVLKVAREVLDALDLFVGRYLVLWVTAYIGFKFLHFKVFPDFPPF